LKRNRFAQRRCIDNDRRRAGPRDPHIRGAVLLLLASNTLALQRAISFCPS
jgi:hypothetical protein